MAFVVSIHDDALAGVASSLVSLSLHTADPGSTGANEVSGGTYARGSLSWNANTGSGSMSANLSITGLPGSITVGWIGFGIAREHGEVDMSQASRKHGTMQEVRQTFPSQ